MSGTHGVFQHRTGYFYTILEEDFCEVYKADGVNEVCRAYITSILEHLTNKQYEATGRETELWVFMSLPEMARRMRHACSERTIHKELTGMIKDGYLDKRRSVGKATMEYKLNVKRLRKALEALPDGQSCNSATYHLANLQEPSSNFARLILQNDKVDLAELQPRIPIDITIEETKIKESTIDASASTRVQSANVISYENGLKRKATDPALKVISHSHNEYTKEEDEPTAKLPAVKKGQGDDGMDNNTLPGNAAVDHPGVQDMEHAERAAAAEAIEALGLEKGQAHVDHSDTSGDTVPAPGDIYPPGTRESGGGSQGRLEHSCGPDCALCNPEQKPGAGGAHFSPADTPPGVSTGDATGVQAPSSNAGTPLPARHGGESPGTLTSAGAAQAIPKRPPRRKPPVMPEPSTIALNEQEQAFWSLWCSAWFNIDVPPKLNETAREHIKKLAPHITTAVQLISLIDFTRKDLEAQGVKRKQVHLGNLVNCYSGWKQSQQPAKTNGTKPFVIDEERNQRHIAEMRARNAEKRERLAANG